MPYKQILSTALLSVMLVAGLSAIGIAVAVPAQAQTPFSLVPECARPKNAAEAEKVDLACALLTFQNVASIIFGISGSVALLIFVYGGFLTLVSGFSDQVKKGKEMIKNAIIGLIIIMVAAYGVDYFILKLTNVRAVNSPCGNNGVWNYVGDQLKCVTKCEEVGEGFACTPSFDGATCNDIIKCSNKAEKCCAANASR